MDINNDYVNASLRIRRQDWERFDRLARAAGTTRNAVMAAIISRTEKVLPPRGPSIELAGDDDVVTME